MDISKAFGLGWASADESHLPELPEALARLLGVPGTTITIMHWNGTAVREYHYPPREEGAEAAPALNETTICEAAQPLGPELTLRIRVDVGPEKALSGEQAELLHQALRLIHAALDSIFIQQRDPIRLGKAFEQLSVREWEICQALELPRGEKEIAEILGCSRHTVHSYVKSLYRKIGVQSRMEVLTHLRQARERTRRGAVDRFVSMGQANASTAPAKDSPAALRHSA